MARWGYDSLQRYPGGHNVTVRGFTLLELSIITAVLAVLFTMGVSAYNRIQSGSRDNKRDLDMHVIYGELERYYEVHGEYPSGYPDTNPSEPASACWLLSSGAMTAPSLDPNTTLHDLQTVLPGIGDDWGDPRFTTDGSTVTSPGDIKPFMSRDLPNVNGRYFFLGSSSVDDISTSRPSYDSLACTFVLPAGSVTPSNYLLGFYGEVDKKWHLLHGLHGEKCQINNCTEGVEYKVDSV